MAPLFLSKKKQNGTTSVPEQKKLNGTSVLETAVFLVPAAVGSCNDTHSNNLVVDVS